jgi:hypothetical protein
MDSGPSNADVLALSGTRQTTERRPRTPQSPRTGNCGRVAPCTATDASIAQIMDQVLRAARAMASRRGWSEQGYYVIEDAVGDVLSQREILAEILHVVRHRTTILKEQFRDSASADANFRGFFKDFAPTAVEGAFAFVGIDPAKDENLIRSIAQKAVQRLRSRRRRVEVKRRKNMTVEPVAEEAPCARMQYAEVWAQIRRRLAPDPQGKKLLTAILAYGLDLTHAEIAEVLDDTENAVSQRLRRLQGRLRRSLSADGARRNSAVGASQT